MKCILFLVWALSIASVWSEGLKFESITTTEGKVYKKVTISKVTPAEIRIIHESGAASIPFEKLPLEIQHRFNYDPLDAYEYREKEAKEQAKLRKILNRKQNNKVSEQSANTENTNTAQTRGMDPETEARAKEAALQAYLAQGGGRRLDGGARGNKRGFRYTEGPIKGLTKGQAIAKFNLMWSKASLRVKAKYAKMGPVVKNPQGSPKRPLGNIRHSAVANKGYQEDHREEILREQAAGWRPGDKILIDLNNPPKSNATANHPEPIRRDRYKREGDRIIINGKQGGGYQIKGNNMYSYPDGIHTHVRSGSIWVPIRPSKHPRILEH